MTTKTDEREEESEQAHHLICELRTIVGRVLFGSDNDEREMDDLVNQADAWVAAWRERRHKRETVREMLSRLGYLLEVMTDASREHANEPRHLIAFIEALEWPTHEGSGRDMRRMIEIFDAHARLVRDATGERVVVGDLVDSLFTKVAPKECAP